MSANTMNVGSQSPLSVDSLGKGSPSHAINGNPVIEHQVSDSKCLYATPASTVLDLCVWLKLAGSNANLKWHKLSLKGYAVKFHSRVSWDGGAEEAAVSLSLKRSRAKRLTGVAFKAVLRHVIEALQASHKASLIDAVLYDALLEYKSENQHAPNEGMQRNQIVGLYGELVFMSWLAEITNDPNKAFDWWKGYDADEKDFKNGGKWAVEVKSSLALKRVYVWINGLKQLEKDGCQKLFLCHLYFDSGGGGTRTLSDLADSIRSSLNPDRKSAFDRALLDAGYDTTIGINYDELKFMAPDWTFFDPLQEGFPSVTTRSVSGDLNLIRDLKYKLKYSDIERFKVNRSVVADEVRSL
jgi:hypothetical protein